MPAATSDVSLESLLSFISTYVVDHFRTTGRRTDGANIADAIRLRFPDFAYEQVGLTRLSDAVSEAERRGLVIRHRDVKHLELSPGPNSGLPSSTDVTAHSTGPLSHVVPEVWRAFVFTSRRNLTYVNRDTGLVVTVPAGDLQHKGTLDGDLNHVRIDSIPTETQQGWMREFAQSRPSLNVESAPIRDDAWWVTFPAWLRQVDSSLESEWNRFRTGKVLDYLHHWAETNRIPVSALLSFDRRPRPAKLSTPEVFRPQHASPDELKRAILASLADLPLEQLQEIEIPIRYLIRHFKPY
jgi:hypothetical protein